MLFEAVLSQLKKPKNLEVKILKTYPTPSKIVVFYSNKRVISLLLTETFKNNKLILSDISCHYTESYKFGDDFFTWFNKTFLSKERNLEDPKNEEVDLVETFFRINIEKTKNIVSEIIYL